MMTLGLGPTLLILGLPALFQAVPTLFFAAATCGAYFIGM